jgi:hypothetical protein
MRFVACTLSPFVNIRYAEIAVEKACGLPLFS